VLPYFLWQPKESNKERSGLSKVLCLRTRPATCNAWPAAAFAVQHNTAIELIQYFPACSFFERIKTANEGGRHKALKALQHALGTVFFPLRGKRMATIDGKPACKKPLPSSRAKRGDLLSRDTLFHPYGLQIIERGLVSPRRALGRPLVFPLMNN
jgi:hypothetical protein